MTISDLQQRLKALGFYSGNVDGSYGSATRTAVLNCLKAGPDNPVSADDVTNAAAVLNTTPAHVRTVRDVEAAGAGFQNGLPKILFEGHIFSKLTSGRFDRTNPAISYPKWDKTKYPATQDGRYNQLLDAVGLDVDAAFSSASYGAFQILGENYRVCGFASSFDFVLAQCQTEGAQLLAFVNFVKGNRLDDALRQGNWAQFARGYNGSAYAQNKYDVRLAQAFATEQAADHSGVLTGTCKITDKINLRSSPGGPIIGVLQPGGFVNVLKDLGVWAQVQCNPTTTGYVAKQFLAKV